VDTNTSTRSATLSAARLLIHADEHVGAGRRHRHESRLHRLLAFPGDGLAHHERLPLNLRIDDLQGHRLHTVDDAGPLVELPLPAGTYQVSVHLGPVRRSYTMTLEPGTSFDLYLRLAPDRR
jgi:hypothetical protein